MIFVVGTGRSGTNMVRDVLNLHPDVYLPQETHWIPKMHEFFGGGRRPLDEFRDIVERTWYHDDTLTVDYILPELELDRDALFERIAARLDDPSSTDVREMNRAFYATVTETAGKRVSGDKTPEYGFYMALMKRLFPDARFVHVVRDGRDVALSMSRHEGFQKMVALRIIDWCPVSFDRYYSVADPRNVDPEALLRMLWDRLPAPVRVAVKRALPAREPAPRAPLPPLDDYIGLWERRLLRIADEATRIDPASILEIRYEEILAGPRAAMSRIAEFVGLPAVEDWLAGAEATLRRDNTGKVERDAQHAHLTRLAEATLAAYGYV